MGNVALVKKLQSSLTLQWVAKPSRGFLPPILITLQLHNVHQLLIKTKTTTHRFPTLQLPLTWRWNRRPTWRQPWERTLCSGVKLQVTIFFGREYSFISCSIFWERIFIWCRRHILNGRESQTRENVRVLSCHLEKLQVEDDPNILQKNATKSETKTLCLASYSWSVILGTNSTGFCLNLSIIWISNLQRFLWHV